MLRAGEEERTALSDAAQLFPDPPRLAALARVARRLTESKASREALRVWVPGCGRGGEVYAIAILLLEARTHSGRDHAIRLYGTDVDTAAIAAARLARYPAAIATSFSSQRLESFFIEVAGGFVVGPRVRELTVFATHDLGQDPPLPSLDLVSCSAALEAMGQAQRSRALRSIHLGLRPGGLLSTASTSGAYDTGGLFTSDPGDPSLLTKVPGDRRSAAADRPNASLTAWAKDMRWGPSATQASSNREALARQLGDRHLLEHHAPASFVVDDRLRILHFRGDVRPHLTAAFATPGARLLDVVAPECRRELCRAIDVALADEPSTPSVDQPGPTGGKLTTASGRAIEVCRLPPSAAGDRCLLVVFRDAGVATDSARATDGSARDPIRGPMASSTLALPKATAALFRTIVELEASNEALYMANEELRVSNTELERLSRELERRRGDESMGMRAPGTGDPPESLSVAAIFVSPSGTIRRFTEAAAHQFGLEAADVGRGIETIGVLSPLDLRSFVEAALREGAGTSIQRPGSDGCRYRITAETRSERAGEASSGVLLRIEKLGASSSE